MNRTYIHNNASCLKCHVVEKEMVRVGVIIFCKKCYEEEFSTLDPVKEEREKYLEWLKINYPWNDK